MPGGQKKGSVVPINGKGEPCSNESNAKHEAVLCLLAELPFYCGGVVQASGVTGLSICVSVRRLDVLSVSSAPSVLNANKWGSNAIFTVVFVVSHF